MPDHSKRTNLRRQMSNRTPERPGAPLMPPVPDYRAKAEECLRMAAETTDSVTASLFRMLADDYLALAESNKPVSQQTQQIQPKTDKT